MKLKTPTFLRNSKGMTLLEIMIVLAILGGLIAVLAGNVMGRFKGAKVKTTKIQMGQIYNALDMYYTDCGSYPPSLDGLVKAPESCSNWGPEPYLKTLPRDAWGTQFVYEVDGASYFLLSLGEDRREGGGDDVSSDDLK